jgi:carboxypeptidase C (cathepsin A)
MKISNIHLVALRNAEYIQFATDFLQILTNNNRTNLKVVDEATALENLLTEISKIYKTDQGSSLTPILESLDAKRDSYVTGIYTTILGFSYHFNEAKQAAANDLLDYLKIYGSSQDITLSTLQAETATINNLVLDFTTKPNLVAALTELGLNPWVDELDTVNTSFSTTYLQRTNELGESNPNNIKQLRITANEKYNELKDMVEGQAIVNKTAPVYATTINSLNALVDQYNATLAARNGRKGDDENGEAPKKRELMA